MKPTKIKNKDGTISYRLQIRNRLDGKRESKSFSSAALCKKWAENRLAEIEREAIYGAKDNTTVKEALDIYQSTFGKDYGRSKNYDLGRLRQYGIAGKKLNELTPSDIIAHCIMRNQAGTKPQTVINDVIWLKKVVATVASMKGLDFDTAIFDRANVTLRRQKLVAKGKKRTRTATWVEMLKITRQLRKKRTEIPIVDIVWFAYFSCRRSAEITRLEWADNNDAKQTGMVRDVKHPTQKEGNHKRFKYEKSAWKIVQRQQRTGKYIFPYSSRTIETYFALACKGAGIKDLHFHDLRRNAVSRLFNLYGYRIEQVMHFSLHDDVKSLFVYVKSSPEDIPNAPRHGKSPASP